MFNRDTVFSRVRKFWAGVVQTIVLGRFKLSCPKLPKTYFGAHICSKLISGHPFVQNCPIPILGAYLSKTYFEITICPKLSKTYFCHLFVQNLFWDTYFSKTVQNLFWPPICPKPIFGHLFFQNYPKPIHRF